MSWVGTFVKAVQTWARRERWRLSFLHLGEGALVFLAAYAVTLFKEPAAGALAVPAFYWGRKQAEVRIRTSLTGMLLDATNPGWTPWQWARVDAWLVVDWVVPTAGSLALWALLA